MQTFPKGLQGGLAALGLALEAWDTWEKSQQEKAFRAGLDTMVANFEAQRKELVEMINGSDFEKRFFEEYVDLNERIEALKQTVQERQAQRRQFSAWRQRCEAIDTEFREMAQ